MAGSAKNKHLFLLRFGDEQQSQNFREKLAVFKNITEMNLKS